MRQYNQNTGTFTSQDPSGINGGLNLYGSRKNNPLRFWDRDGRMPAEQPVPGSYGPDPSINPWKNAENAANDAETTFPDEAGEDDRADAYRHCLASCLVTQGSGSASAFVTGESYEIYGDLFNNQSPGAKCMDRSNNAYGRDRGREGKNCADACFEGAVNGRTQNSPR